MGTSKQAIAAHPLYHDITALYPKLDQAHPDPDVSSEMIKLILHEMGPGFAYQSELISFYDSIDYKPLWISDYKLSQQAQYILNHLDMIWSHGLQPADYNSNVLKYMVQDPLWQESLLHRMLLDISISDALAKLTQDMTRIRVDEKDAHIDRSHWRTAADPVTILKSIYDQKQPIQKILHSLEPDNALYQELRFALIHEVQMMTSFHEVQNQLNKLDFETIDYFKPGDKHETIPYIRQHIMAAFDPRKASQDRQGEVSQSLYYDSHMAQLVRQFQRRHFIKDDALLGPQTLSIINKTRIEKIEQIIVNLERLRWIDFSRPDKYIVVNVPSAQLWAIENNYVLYQMPVVVGRKDRPTQSFVTHIKGVRVNPSWTVPMTIKMKDFFPKIKDDPSILAEKNIRIYKGFDRSKPALDPEIMDWDNVTYHSFKYMNLVQGPGPNNALGQFRFLMPNPYEIYLHGTNDDGLFSESFRAHSSGCIRLSEPDKIARFVLEDRKQDDPNLIDHLIQTGDETNVTIKKHVPVYILYLTMWFQDDGALVYGPDIYGYDTQLIRSLRHKNAIFIPDIINNAQSTRFDNDKKG